MTGKAHQQTRNIDELARHSKLDVPDGGALLGSNPALISEIDRHGAPISSEIIELKSRNAIFGIPFDESRVFQDITVEDVFADSVVCLSSTYRGRFEQHENPLGCVAVGVVFATDQMDQ